MDQDKKINYRQDNDIKNKIWKYMRRNRIFRVGDLFMIFNISYSSLKPYLKALEDAEYIKFVGRNRKPYSDIQFTLIKNTGIFAPKLNGNALYDRNSKEKIEISRKMNEKISYPEKLMNILDSIDCEEMTFDELMKKADCQVSGLRKWWKRLINFGIIVGNIKNESSDNWYISYKRKDKKLIYKFNLDNAKKIKEELLKGAYTKSEPEMKHLWITEPIKF
jgi:hypothetical protein